MLRYLAAAESDLDKIAHGSCDNFKMRFGRGNIGTGGSAILPAQRQSRNVGVPSEYLCVETNPCILAHGTSQSNARIVRNNGLGRGGRYRIHFGVAENGRASGIRAGSEVACLSTLIGVLRNGCGFTSLPITSFFENDSVVLHRRISLRTYMWSAAGKSFTPQLVGG